MKILKKIYSEPKGLFEEVTFNKGLNLIVGIPKKEEGKTKISLNSIGKSTLISLIDFCLLSEFNKAHKLYKAKSFMDTYQINLELELDDENITIKRSTSSPRKISILSDVKDSFDSIDLDVARQILFEKLFSNKDYLGIQDNKWLRSVIPIFLRNEKEGYGSPLEYIKQANIMSLNIFHLMLLNINNALSITNKKDVEEIKKKKDDIKGIEKILIEEYGDLGAINSKLDKLQKEVESLGSIKNNLNFEGAYSLKEEEVEKLTEEIKNLIIKNSILKDQLNGYKKSHNLKIEIDAKKIQKIYTELNEEIGIKLSKTLEEAVDYKNKLLNSRKNFINKKIIEINEQIGKNDLKKEELKRKQSEIMKFLEEKKLFSNIKDSFKLLNEKEKELFELKGKTSLLDSLKKILLKLDTSYSKLLEEINQFIDEIQLEKVGGIRNIYNSIYEKLYPQEGEGFFDIIFDKNRDCKISIVASSKDGDGFGKNRGCVLVYDLTILFNILEKKLPYPNFWIHDGVFYGMYKNQLMDTLKFIKEKSDTENNFQYIITLNLDEQGRIISDLKEIGINLEDCKIAEYSNITSEKIFRKDF